MWATGSDTHPAPAATRRQPSRQPHGFTLIELLVALFVTAIMFALGYGAITQALDNRDRVRGQQQRLN
jgi:prepilin-type N-terminal cleavage/methylation domain-containing protein